MNMNKLNERIRQISHSNDFLILGMLSVIVYAVSLVCTGWTFDQISAKDWLPPLFLLVYLATQKSFEQDPELSRKVGLMVLDTLVTLFFMLALGSTVWLVVFLFLLFFQLIRLGGERKWVNVIRYLYAIGSLAAIVWLFVAHTPDLSVPFGRHPAVLTGYLSSSLLLGGLLLSRKDFQPESYIEVVFLVQICMRVFSPFWGVLCFMSFQSVLLSLVLILLHYLQLRTEERKEGASAVAA